MPLSTDSTNPKDLLGAAKVDMSQICPVAMAHEALAMMDGTRKYGFRNWRDKKVKAMVYVAAALRHINQWAEGEENATDGPVATHHLGNARACLAILLDAQANGNLIDDRVPGVYPAVLAELNERIKAASQKG